MNITTMIPCGHISQREMAHRERSVCLRGKIGAALGTSWSSRFHFELIQCYTIKFMCASTVMLTRPLLVHYLFIAGLKSTHSQLVERI